MTTISVPGKITAIEVDDGKDFAIVSLIGGPAAMPTVIMPSGKPVTVVLFVGSPDSLGVPNQAWFRLDASFDIGEVVETYAVGQAAQTISDENGMFLAGGADIRVRKILSGAPTYTDTNGNVHPLAIWRHT